MPCSGNSRDHCCYVAGAACKHLEKNTVAGRYYACGLRRKLGDWDLVLASDEYKKDVAPAFEPLEINCRDWPYELGQGCSNCGEGR